MRPRIAVGLTARYVRPQPTGRGDIDPRIAAPYGCRGSRARRVRGGVPRQDGVVVGTEEVLDEVNAQLGRRWELSERLEGGFQSGAHRVSDERGPVVLKWWDRPWWAPRVLAARALVDTARHEGYPTPAWLGAGTTSHGFPFEVQELVEGDKFGPLDRDRVAALVEVVLLQRQIELAPATDWSDYVRRLIFEDTDGAVTRLRSRGPATAAAVEESLRFAEPFRNADVPNTEMVHGDFSTDNILQRDGRIVAIVDIEAIGRGFAGYDLLTPARQAYLWNGDRSMGDLLVAEGVAMYGPAPIALALAAHVINILDFGLDHWSTGHEQAALACLDWITAAAAGF